MNIDNAVEDIVLLVQQDGQPLKGLGIRDKKIYVRLKGYDSIGLWVELTDYNLPQLAHSESGPVKEITADASPTKLLSLSREPSLTSFAGSSFS